MNAADRVKLLHGPFRPPRGPQTTPGLPDALAGRLDAATGIPRPAGSGRIIRQELPNCFRTTRVVI